MRGVGVEFFYDEVMLGLVYVIVYGWDGEIMGSEFVGKLVDFVVGVVEDDGLGDGDSFI